jgi:hypothetical protein
MLATRTRRHTNPPAAIGDGLREALRVLHQAYAHSRAFHCDPWDFAVEWAGLRPLGMTSTDVRWLVRHGFIEHAVEIVRDRGGRREFRRLGPTVVLEGTALVLTDTGAAFTCKHLAAEERLGAGSIGARRLKPAWDRERRELVVGGQLVKRFRVPAASQERILDAFEEEGWPQRIDDPLPHTNNLVPRARLHDAIKNLNRHHVHRLIVFQGDGRGVGICWKRIG